MTAQEQTYFGRPGDFMTVRHLTIRGTNFEIGRTLGALAIERYGRTPAHLVAEPLYARARRLYTQRHYPIHWARMRDGRFIFAPYHFSQYSMDQSAVLSW